jgi:hypothetical protein
MLNNSKPTHLFSSWEVIDGYNDGTFWKNFLFSEIVANMLLQPLHILC